MNEHNKTKEILSKLLFTFMLIVTLVPNLNCQIRTLESDKNEDFINKQKVTESLNRLLTNRSKEGFSGIIFIAKGDSIIFYKSFSEDSSVQRDSRFWIGSLTKSFTACAIMKLQEKGKIMTSDPLVNYYENIPENKKHISVHHLLTHTSGMGSEYISDRISDKEKALQAILSLPIIKPGDIEYSNDAYNLLAILIEDRSGKSYEDFIRENIFEKSNMKNSGFWWVNPKASENAFASVKQLPDNDRMLSTWGYRGSTGLYSTIEDLFQWHSALKNDKILNTFSMQTMTSPHIQFSHKMGYGYGFEIIQTSRNTLVIGHIGANSELEHFVDYKYFKDEDIVFIFFSNSPENLSFSVFAEVEKIFFQN